MAQQIDTNKWYSDAAIDKILEDSGKNDEQVQAWRESIDGVPATHYVHYANEALEFMSANFRVTEARELDMDNGDVAEDGDTDSYFEWKLTEA